MTLRKVLAALGLIVSVPILALACKDKATGSNPGALVSIQADPNGTFASVQANGAVNEVPGNVTHFLSTGNFGNVKNGAGSVYSMQLISRDTTAAGAYLQIADNTWVEAGAQPNTAPSFELGVPAAAATVFPGPVVVGTFAPQAAVYCDAGINYCVSTSATTCTPVADAGAYNVMVQYQ